MPILSQRGYAKHRAELGLSGGTHRAVQKAIAGGRIVLTAEKLIDSDAADRAWADNTSEGHRRNAAELEQSEAKAVVSPGYSTTAAPVSTPVVPRAATAEQVTLARASAMEKGYRAKIAQLDFEERSGKLVDAEQVKIGWASIVAVSRNKILGVPSKLRERLPELAPAQLKTIEETLREALEDLANGVG